MATLFISDLHLDPARPALGGIFRRFMQGPARTAEALYILGDLFEMWVGDDGGLRRFHEAVAELSALTRSGVPVYFMHGNYDFLVGEDFARATGVRLLQDPSTVSLYGEQTLLTHGDALCTDDLAHQAARRRWLDPAHQARVLALPVWVRNGIARWLKLKSGLGKARKTLEIMDVNQGAVSELMRTHGVQRMIHGHTHRPATHVLQIDGRQAQRIVLPSWSDDAGGVLVCEPGGCRLQPLH